MLILGGGVVKHHICNANLMRNGADFSVFINTGSISPASRRAVPHRTLLAATLHTLFRGLQDKNLTAVILELDLMRLSLGVKSRYEVVVTSLGCVLPQLFWDLTL